MDGDDGKSKQYETAKWAHVLTNMAAEGNESVSVDDTTFSPRTN